MHHLMSSLRVDVYVANGTSTVRISLEDAKALHAFVVN